jgi:hypothetical protein
MTSIDTFRRKDTRIGKRASADADNNIRNGSICRANLPKTTNDWK